jgi:mycothiol synthase
MADVEALAALMNAYSLAIRGRETLTLEQVKSQMGTPGFDPKMDTILVLSPKGDLVAIATVFDLAPPHVRVNAQCVVHPQHMWKGIGTTLAEWIEERASQAVPEAPDGARVYLGQSLDEKEKAAQDLLEGRGYSTVRHFWRMLIEMDAPPPAPVFPDGVRVRAVDPEKDLVRGTLAARDAFKDHWGYVEVPLDKELERYRYQMANDPDFDPTLFFFGVQGDEIAGVCYCLPKLERDESTGYVMVLGVRRPWRRQGLALALLHHAFGEFYRRGVKRVALHVDAQSLTGATRLYEKAGMHPDETSHAYEKELRPGFDLATQSLRE